MGNSSSARRVRRKKNVQEMSAEGKRAFLESTAGKNASDVDALTGQLKQMTVSGSSSSSTSSSAKKANGYQLKVRQPVKKSVELDEARKSETLFAKQKELKSTPPSNRTAYPSKKWSPEEDELLREAVAEFNAKNWKAIAQRVPDKTHLQCLQRWKKVLQPGLIKGHWTEEEDNMLRSLVDESGSTSWVAVAKYIPGRTAKQCRERWSLNLDPSINRGPWTAEEDKHLLALHEQLGNKWAEISGHMEGRTENAVKTRYKSIVRAMQKQWTPAEDRVLVDAKATASNRWVAIASQLPGRSKNAVRQRWKFLVAEYPNLDEVVDTDRGYVWSLPVYMQNAYHPTHPIHAEMRPSEYAQAAMAARPPPILEHVVHEETHEERMRALPPLEHTHDPRYRPTDTQSDISNQATTSSIPDSASVSRNDDLLFPSSNTDYFAGANASPSAYSTDGEASRLMDANYGFEAESQYAQIKAEPNVHITNYGDEHNAGVQARVKYEPFHTTHHHHPTMHHPAGNVPPVHGHEHLVSDAELTFDDFSAPINAQPPTHTSLGGLEVGDMVTSGLEDFAVTDDVAFPNHGSQHPQQASTQDLGLEAHYGPTTTRGPSGILAAGHEMSATSFTSQDQFMLIDALQDAPVDENPPKIMIR
ncbi:Transcription factor MYB3R-2 [Hondaea fermentalgiana]|uniref:Transcription factor MYB3R-2 n=1 Tax=Hondaea fermentalgiana TaxID=2315210 RepID=A0A2R5GQM7_9STRA|nr:Transcription factor MYB3R-2 [Hondaea fermentalgiana]|eukprot:GBG30661.1 Transcription factor MYB3R-2 [Hondaea fermentalgiana]